jgi:hypothetical protein
MFGSPVVDVGRQYGLHDCVPHNWFGELAEECPLVTGEGVATVVADRVGLSQEGLARSIVKGRVTNRPQRRPCESLGFFEHCHCDAHCYYNEQRHCKTGAISRRECRRSRRSG